MVCAFCAHPLLIGMCQDTLEVVRLQRVEDVEEVLAWWATAWRVRVREELHELCVLLDIGPQGLHRELVVVWNCDLPHIGLLHELLLAAKNIF